MNDQPKKKDVLRETDAKARTLATLLIRTARYGALAALDPTDGSPLASRVAVATDHDGAPLILTSSLSAHTGAILADPRCSLLLGEPGRGDPLAHPRVSLVCEARRLERGTEAQARAERRYLARHPKARLYAGFGDFAFFRLGPMRASLNGGFGKAYALESGDLLLQSDALDGVAAMEDGAVAHMNEDHGEAIALYARYLAQPKPENPDAGWVITGIDPAGFDLACGDLVARVAFPHTLSDAAEVRPMLVDMARRARSQPA